VEKLAAITAFRPATSLHETILQTAETID
jgi:hypothetical protein